MSTTDAVHALLFVADSPASVATLAAALQVEPGEVDAALERLEAKLEGGPIRLVKLAGGWQLSTRPEYAPILAAFLKPSRQRLSRALMEVLAIVAYRQPVTLAEIEAIRGVGCDYGIRSLLERRLVKEAGRKQAPGRPVLYATTDEFLHQFKMHDLTQLPAVDEGPLSLPT
ncbi:SMC-Scp complex subunit ScpB [bacterium]|nr:MAG: SMC-Scp complex subunit ScpB [bacterium]